MAQIALNDWNGFSIVTDDPRPPENCMAFADTLRIVKLNGFNLVK